MASNHDSSNAAKQGGLVTTVECMALARETRTANAEALFEGCFGMTRADYEASEAQTEWTEAEREADCLADLAYRGRIAALSHLRIDHFEDLTLAIGEWLTHLELHEDWANTRS